jgi:hypothetical protein
MKDLLAAEKLLASHGLTPARIVARAGTDYIVASDGSLRKIGRKPVKAGDA